MASEVSNTLRGLQTVSQMASDGGKTRQHELAKEVSVILSPDAMTALQRRSAAKAKPESSPGRELNHGGHSARSQREISKLKEKSLASIDVEDKHYARDIQTTKEMADQVTNILGATVLDSLKHSRHERKKDKMHRKKEGKHHSAHEKKDKTSEEESSESEREEYGARPGRIRRNRSKDSEDKHAPPSNSKHGQKKPSSHSRKASDGGRSKSPMKKTSQSNRRKHHPKKLANHAKDVGIDVEEYGLDEIFDEEEAEQHSTKKDTARRKHPHSRKRHPRPEKTISGAKPGRRGRNGTRGGGTKLGNIRQAQMAAMTRVDQSKQYHEEDFNYSSGSEEDSEEEEYSETEVQERNGEEKILGHWTGRATQAYNTAGERAAEAAARAKTAAAGLGEGFVGAFNAAATTTVGMVSRDGAEGNHGYSSNEEDEPKVKASMTSSDDDGPSWGFTGGGLPS